MLGIFWICTDWLSTHFSQHPQTPSSKLTPKTDLSTLLFFLGILMAVAALESIGLLHFLSTSLDQQVHTIYLINLIIGLLSAIIDNVPLVAAAIGMYPMPTSSLLQQSIDPHYLQNFIQNGNFWNLLAYCAGTGGSLLIIGSAAGVIVMGLEKINFIWYLKQITWRALLGFLGGIVIYYLQAIILSF
jgi:Na+/H+ antiporter NhaD/arsenite permease-like protein